MKHTIEIFDLSGLNESPVSGDFIISSNRDFVTRGVTTASIITNGKSGISGTVSAVTASKITSTGMMFNPGDPFHVTLAVGWILQNADVPVIEVECNVCGFCYPQKQLTKGRCKTCIDKE
jgi:hypothetical protein